MGRLIAYTAMLEKREVTWFPSYGAEIRGGTACCTVVISDEIIGSPVIESPDVLIVFNNESLDLYLTRLKPNGQLFYDSSLISSDTKIPRTRCFGIVASETASNLGNIRVANMVMLGAVAKAALLVNKTKLLQALRENVKNHVTLNKNAILEGYKLIDKKD